MLSFGQRLNSRSTEPIEPPTRGFSVLISRQLRLDNLIGDPRTYQDFFTVLDLAGDPVVSVPGCPPRRLPARTRGS